MAYDAVNAKLHPNSGLGPTVFEQVSLDSASTRAPRPVSRLSNTPVADVLELLPDQYHHQHHAHHEDYYSSSAKDGGHQQFSTADTTPDKIQYRVFTHWKWEILSLLLSIGIVVAMFVLLVEFNDKLVADWRFPINLTTLLALLATVMRAALFVPITSIISQAKWRWFGDKPRPLQDLQDIDSGSRSMLGAISLVPLAARASVPTLIAVALSVVSLGIGPFVQQAVGTQTCVRRVENAEAKDAVAMVPYTHYVSSPYFVPRQTAGNQSNIQAMVYASLTGVLDPGNEIRYQCTTGNCTFDNGTPPSSNGFKDKKGEKDPNDDDGPDGSSVFSTMAMCHKCFSVADFVNWTNPLPITTAGELPNGLKLQVGGPTTVGIAFGPNKFGAKTGGLSWAEASMDAETRHMAAMALANVTVMTYVNEHGDSDLDPVQRQSLGIAQACVLYACIRTYSVAVTNGQLREQQLSTTPARTAPTKAGKFPSSGDFVAVKDPCWVGNKTYELTKQNTWTCTHGTNLRDEAGSAAAEKCEPDGAETRQCFYRQDNLHATGMTGALDYHFNLDCFKRSGALNCYERTTDLDGRGAWAEELFYNNVTVAKIDARFDTFARTISNRYRMSFGGSKTPDPGNHEPSAAANPDLGQVRGTVLQTTACNVVHLAWLSFPAALVVVTAAILLWTMAEAWLRRGERPVWKDSLLPLMLYSHRFKTHDEGGNEESSGPVYNGDGGGGGGYSRPLHHDNDRSSGNGGSSPLTPAADDSRLLETYEMGRIAKTLQVRFSGRRPGIPRMAGLRVC
ncbi:hypothetical protein PG995_007560 [Apiospora arundinis]